MLSIIIVFVVVGVVGAKDRDGVQGSSSYSSSAAAVTDTSSAPVTVSSDQLQKDYSVNEISADDKYRGKLLIVSGAVQSVRKDFMDDPVVELWTTNELEPVSAHFSKASAGSLSSIAPGNHISVRCVGNNVVMGRPQLKKCAVE